MGEYIPPANWTEEYRRLVERDTALEPFHYGPDLLPKFPPKFENTAEEQGEE
jgi:hypothetical protein